MSTTTDHSVAINRLRTAATDGTTSPFSGLVYQVAADLLEIHDQTGISLDNWRSARTLVEILMAAPLQENGV